MLFELIKCCHDNSFAKWTEVLGDRKRAVNMRNVTVVGLDLVEDFVALLAPNFFHWALVGNVRFPACEFLENKREVSEGSVANELTYHFTEETFVNSEAESISIGVFDDVVG